jgi:broad specificity phosphatase PhoE
VTPCLILIRHGEVESAWKKICYGAMDVPLSESGMESSTRLADRIVADFNPRYVFHSGLHRTKFLASEIASRSTNRPELIVDTRLQERYYGDWQGKSWDEVFGSDPDHFHDLIEQPETYRPPRGETTSEMQSRITSWLRHVEYLTSDCQSWPIVAITHSGPIAAACGHLLKLHARDWGPWTLSNLQAVMFDHLGIDGPVSPRKVHA